MNIKNISLKTVSFFLFIVIVVSLFCQPCFAEQAKLPNTKHAGDICLYNINADKYVYKQSDGEKIFPASAVKIMTGLIACEMLSDRLNEEILITADKLSGSEGASIKLKAGMSVTVEELLSGVLCGGGNDAAIVVAKLCAGNVDDFVKLMNDKCDEWGLTSTNFTNPTGLDDEKMFTTLSDIVKLAKLASQNELYVRLSSLAYFSYSPYGNDETIKIYNRNALISTYYADGYKNTYAKGLMTSNTDLGGYSAIIYAVRGTEAYICVVMNAKKVDNTIYSYKYANQLLSYAFGNLKYTKVLDKGKDICFAEVGLASPEDGDDIAKVLCVASEEAYALVPSEIDVETDLTYKYYLHYDTLEAPIEANTVVGGVDVIYDGEVIATSKLVISETVEPNPMIAFFHNARTFFGSRTFILCLCFTVIFLLIYLYIYLLKSHRRTVKNIQYKNFY